MVRYYKGCYLDSMELMRNVGSLLVLELIVIGNEVLSILKEYRYQRIYDNQINPVLNSC